MKAKRVVALVCLLQLVAYTVCAAELTDDDILYYEVYGAEIPGDKTLAVFLHGDSGRHGVPGQVSRYLFDAAKRFSDKHPGKVIGVGLLRPGYRDKIGNKSPGRYYRREDDKTKRKNAIVAYTVAHLKQKYNATRVFGVGHSGGAIMLGAIIGQQPDLFNAVVPVSMACDIPQYRRHRNNGRNSWPRSQSPKKFAKKVSPDIVIRVIAGEKDNNILPHHANDCVRLYKKRGIDAEAIIVKGAGHTRGLLVAMEENLDKLLLAQ